MKAITGVAAKVAAAIGILAACLTGVPDQAAAATGRINIQTVPEGARYLIFTNKGLIKVHEGTAPFYDNAFPTGAYRACFELDGHETVWQDFSVSTASSAWIGPVMVPSTRATRTTCEDDLARIKAVRGAAKASFLEKAKYFERPAQSPDTVPPSVAPSTTITVDDDDDDDYYDRRREDRADELRDRVDQKRRLEGR